MNQFLLLQDLEQRNTVNTVALVLVVEMENNCDNAIFCKECLSGGCFDFFVLLSISIYCSVSSVYWRPRGHFGITYS